MRLAIKRRYVVQGAIIIGLAPTVAGSCGDITQPGNPSSQGCTVTADPNFPTTGTFVVNKPATCPMKILGPTPVDYAATGTVPAGSVTAYQYQLTITDKTGYTWGANYQSAWNLDGYNWVVAVTGNYSAALGGFDAYNNGYDIANNQVYVNGQWAASHTRLAYTLGSPGLDIAGPLGGVGSGVTYYMNATTNDLSFVAPISWSWYVDGTLRSNSQQFEWQGGSQGSSQSITVQAVDANGLTHTQGSQVTTCSGTEIYC